MLSAPRTEEKPNGIELKSRSASPKTDAEPVAGGEKDQAAKPLYQRVEDNAFHRFARKIGLQFCHQMLAE